MVPGYLVGDAPAQQKADAYCCEVRKRSAVLPTSGQRPQLLHPQVRLLHHRILPQSIGCIL
jgi:hypothetical protein